MAGEMAFLYGTPAGVAGSISRPLDSEVESVYLGATPPTAYGTVLVGDGAGKYIAIAGSNVQSDIKGFLARSVPNISGGIDNTFTANTPNATYIQGRMYRGYMRVTCTQGTPVKGGAVYVRTVADTGKLVGDLESVSDVSVAGGVITGTGTGTIAATVSATAIVGTWSLKLQTTSQTSLVTVIDPNGVRHLDATVGTAYTSGGLTFTITAAGTMTAGDSFSPVVSTKSLAILGAEWALSGKDANNVSEIRYTA